MSRKPPPPRLTSRGSDFAEPGPCGGGTRYSAPSTSSIDHEAFIRWVALQPLTDDPEGDFVADSKQVVEHIDGGGSLYRWDSWMQADSAVREIGERWRSRFQASAEDDLAP